MKIKIEITKEDIEGATRRDVENCPIARALQRHGFEGAVVSVPRFELGPRYIATKRRTLPRTLVDEALRFDDGKTFRPCEFYLHFEDFA